MEALVKIFVLLSALLCMAATSPIIVPHTPSQLFIRLLEAERQHQQQHPGQLFYYQRRLVERSDQHHQSQNFGSDYAVGESYNEFDAHGNGLGQGEEVHSGHEFGDQLQQQQLPPQHQHDYSAFTNFNSQVEAAAGHELGDDHNLAGQHEQQTHYVQSIPVSEHVEVTRPVAVPVYKEIGIPVPHPVKIKVPHPVTVGVPQPYPVAIPVAHPVPIQIIKTIAVPVEKKVPYPVEKHIPVPVEKPVPIKIEKHIPVPVYKPYPIKVPVYKTIYHHAKRYNRHNNDDDDDDDY